MGTDVLNVDPLNDFAEQVRVAASILADGGLVAFPTETVYGLGARADNANAVARLRSVKQRPAEIPFTVHIGEVRAIHDFVPHLNGLAGRLVRKGLPGPLTLILEVETPVVAPIMNQLDQDGVAAVYYDGTVGIRCPDDPIASLLLRSVGAPVVAASANLAGGRPPETGQDVLSQLDGQIDFILDAGRAKYGRPSTIIKLHGNSLEMVREGVYDQRTIDRLSTLRILFVCTGNTCRSPMAAGIAGRALASQLGCSVGQLAAEGIIISSAGTAGGAGGPSEGAVRAMKNRGIDISHHLSQAITPDMVRQADYTFVMTRGHLDAVMGMASPGGGSVALLLENQEIADPLGDSEDAYESCARSIEVGVAARLEEAFT